MPLDSAAVRRAPVLVLLPIVRPACAHRVFARLPLPNRSGVLHPSTRQTTRDRAIDQAVRLRRDIGGSGNLLEPFQAQGDATGIMAEAIFKVPEIRAEEPLERASRDCRTVGSACTRTESEEEETTGRDPNKERSEALTRHAVCWGRRIHPCVF